MKKVKAQLGSRTKRPSKEKIAAVVGKLFLVDDHLPSKVRRQILDLGPLAVPFLLEMLFDPRDVDEHVPGPGKFPLHAIRLLGELRAKEAVPGLIAFQEQVFPGSPLAVAIEEARARIEGGADSGAEADSEAEAEADSDSDADSDSEAEAEAEAEAGDPRARLLAMARKLAGG